MINLTSRSQILAKFVRSHEGVLRYQNKLTILVWSGHTACGVLVPQGLIKTIRIRFAQVTARREEGPWIGWKFFVDFLKTDAQTRMPSRVVKSALGGCTSLGVVPAADTCGHGRAMLR